MKLQKRLSRKYKDKKYYKYLIVIPEKEIKKVALKRERNLKLKLKEGQSNSRLLELADELNVIFLSKQH